MSMKATTVDVRTRLQMIDADGTVLPVDASFHYDPNDPYAVRLEMQAVEVVRWWFARDLLVGGLDGPAGDEEAGDVQIRPWVNRRSGALSLSLRSPDGQCLLRVPRSAVVRLLRRSTDLVPLGSESQRIDWDRELRHILPTKRKPRPRGGAA